MSKENPDRLDLINLGFEHNVLRSKDWIKCSPAVCISAFCSLCRGECILRHRWRPLIHTVKASIDPQVEKPSWPHGQVVLETVSVFYHLRSLNTHKHLAPHQSIAQNTSLERQTPYPSEQTPSFTSCKGMSSLSGPPRNSLLS